MAKTMIKKKETLLNSSVQAPVGVSQGQEFYRPKQVAESARHQHEDLLYNGKPWQGASRQALGARDGRRKKGDFQHDRDGYWSRTVEVDILKR